MSKTAEEIPEGRQKALEELISVAGEIQDQIEIGEIPEIEIPTSTKSNIQYDEETDTWEYGDNKTSRTANQVSGARKLLKTSYAIDFLAKQIEENRSSTLRELYYISESWKKAQFESQDESNHIVEDLEKVTEEKRGSFGLRPEESGATIIGPLEIREQTRRGSREIHCQDGVGEGGYQIPNNPDTIEFLSNDADFVLAVETGGMRDRLVENGFDEEYNVLIVHLKGQPSRATRRIIKRFNMELDLPIGVFTDADPWSYRIYSSVAYGAIKTAHLSDYLATPAAEYVGIRPVDIIEYDLPTDPLSDSDINALESELDDPRFQTDFWIEQIETQLEIGKKAEQQSLASRGLDFVTESYLPERLDEMGYL